MKLTKIGIALLATLLMLLGLTASAASALSFNSSSSPVTLTGSQNGNHTFMIDNVAFECESATMERAAQLATPATLINGITAAYSKCTYVKWLPVSVSMGTCTFTLDSPNITPEVMGSVSIKCNNNTNNGNIRITSGAFGMTCVTHIAEQSEKSTVTYQNNLPTTGQVRMSAEITGITANTFNSHPECPGGESGPVNVVYKGVTDLQIPNGVAFWIN